jgi:hypothetical protein
VMLYVYDAVSDQAYDRAYKYARALEPYLAKNIKPKKVRALIESDGGLEKLYDRAKKQIPLRKGRAEEPADPERNDDDTVFHGDGEAGGEDRPNRSGASKHRDRRQRLTLEIEISAKRLDRVFGMSQGQEGTLRFKSLGVNGDWHRFRATKLKIPAIEESSVRGQSERRRIRVSARKTGPQRAATPGPVRSSTIPSRRQDRR